MANVIQTFAERILAKGLVPEFRRLRWPLSLFAEGVERVVHKEQFPSVSRFRLRMARYWFASCEIEAHSLKLDRPITIVDLGCERGLTKSFSPPEIRAQWIGLDRTLDRPELPSAGYDVLHRCEFDQRLPLESASADVVICLHVMEHLPNPGFLASEIQRVLRRDGILIAATPVLPLLFARIRERQLRRKIQRGVRTIGRHVNAFSVSRWCELLKSAGLKPDAIGGAHFFRSDRSSLENHGWWIRLNQFWGVLFPSLGRELFVLASRVDSHPGGLPSSEARFSQWHWRRGLAKAAVAMLIGVLSIATALDSNLEKLVQVHHDEADVYYIHSEIAHLFHDAENHNLFFHRDDLETILVNDLNTGRHTHLIVAPDHIEELAAHPASSDLRELNRLVIRGQEVILIGIEGTGPSIRKKATIGLSTLA